MILGYVRITGTSGFGEKNNKNFEKSEKNTKKIGNQPKLHCNL